MQHSRARIFAILIGVLMLMTIMSLDAQTMDISLNGRNLAVMDTRILAAFSSPLPASEDSEADLPTVGLPLSALYPWMESVEHLEMQSGPVRVTWEGDGLKNLWPGAILVRRSGVWSLQIGTETYPGPDRLSLRGVALKVPELRIWSAIELPALKLRLQSILALKGTTLNWRIVRNPSRMLSSPPSEGLPHLLLFDYRTPGIPENLVTAAKPVASTSASMFTQLPAAASLKANMTNTLAVDAYKPEAALYILHSDGSELFSDDGNLSSELGFWMTRAMEARSDGSLLVSDKPLEVLAAGQADRALRLPDSEDEAGYSALTPVGDSELLFPVYAAVPLNQTDENARDSSLLLTQITALTPADVSNLPEYDPRTRRFYRAYERIGRLVLSGQMGVQSGINLMNRTISTDDRP